MKGFSQIDILVNNAGINIPKQALDVTETIGTGFWTSI